MVDLARWRTKTAFMAKDETHPNLTLLLPIVPIFQPECSNVPSMTSHRTRSPKVPILVKRSSGRRRASRCYEAELRHKTSSNDTTHEEADLRKVSIIPSSG